MLGLRRGSRGSGVEKEILIGASCPTPRSIQLFQVSIREGHQSFVLSEQAVWI